MVALQAASPTAGGVVSNTAGAWVYPAGTVLDPTVDADGDSFTVDDGDCNDADASVYPAASDTVGDGLDQSCDGVDGHDGDADGFASVTSGGTDCDDTTGEVHPGAFERCDRQANDCDQAWSPTDEDGVVTFWPLAGSTVDRTHDFAPALGGGEAWLLVQDSGTLRLCDGSMAPTCWSTATTSPSRA